MKRRVSLVVTDLDNTLWDWVAIWYAGFSAMLDDLVATSGFPRELLEAQIKGVYEAHGTSEYAFLIEELPCLREKNPTDDLTLVYASAIEAYRTARRRVVRLYEGVEGTLTELKRIGCPVVAYTESLGFYTMTRLKGMGLDGLLAAVYSPPDHAAPEDLRRHYDDAHYRLGLTVHRFTPPGELKPNPDILLSIIRDSGLAVTPGSTIYVGDSLIKDISMAQGAGVADVHAAYGLSQHTEAYEALRRVTHWPAADVEKERVVLAGATITPAYVLGRSFEEILDLFDFTSTA